MNRFIIIKDINTFIQQGQGCIKLIKSDGKDFYNVIKDFYLEANAVLLSIQEAFSKNPEEKYHSFHNFNLFSTLIMLRNISWAAY